MTWTMFSVSLHFYLMMVVFSVLDCSGSFWVGYGHVLRNGYYM